MSMQVYQNSATEAVHAFQSGNYRQSANKYLESFLASPGKYSENRWQIFHGYTSVLQDEYFTASQSDVVALQRIVEDKHELKLYRCEAAFTLGFSWRLRDREESATCYRDAIRIGEKAPENERRKKVLATLTTPDGSAVTGLGVKPIGGIIDEILAKTRGNLSAMEHGSKAPSQVRGSSSPPMRSNGTPMPYSNRQSEIALGPLPTAFTKEQGDFLLSVGGERCDCCKETRAAKGLKHLLQCSQCKRAFYCSSECQRQQWKAGHKKHCRKPGEIKPSDIRRINGIQSKPEINGKLVEVMAVDPNNATRWQVRIPGGDRSLSLAPDKLEQLRPLK